MLRRDGESKALKIVDEATKLLYCHEVIDPDTEDEFDVPGVQEIVDGVVEATKEYYYEVKDPDTEDEFDEDDFDMVLESLP